MQTAEQLFNDNVRYNRSLAKSMTRPKHRVAPRLKGWCSTVKVAIIVTPDEVIKKLEEHGLDITRRTLLRWEGEGLIPKPERGSYGQGGGKWTDYPDETIPEALTASILKDAYRLKHAEIAEARKAHKERRLAPYAGTWGAMLNLVKDEGYERAKQGGPFGFEFYKQVEGYIETELGKEPPERFHLIREVFRLHQAMKKNEAVIEAKLKTGEISEDMPLSEALEILEGMKPNDS